jgi:cytochrome c
MKKKIVLVSMVALWCFACNNASNESTSTTKTDTAKTEVAPPVETMKNGITKEDYEKGLALIGSSDCLTCHKVSEKLVGPAYKDVANRYTANADTINMLAGKIINGGAGRWGEAAMTSHPNLSKEDAVQMVKYVLAIE